MFGPLARFAHEASQAVTSFSPEDDLEANISSLALRTVTAAAITLFVLVIIAALSKNRKPQLKLPLFVLMVTTMVGSVGVLLVSTVYLNTQSDSGGPIHWHADIEYWACGNQLELRDPEGLLSNKIGTPVLHEHDDQRIHMEGVIVDKSVDASLGKFFYVVGGEITSTKLSLPLNLSPDRWFEDHQDGDGPAITNSALVADFISSTDEHGVYATFENGQPCGEEPAEVQVYVYHFYENDGGDVYWQEKVSDPAGYTIAEEPNVPPGDCVIVEFGPKKDRTDKLCEQFGIRDVEKCEAFGVLPGQKGICTAREVSTVTENGEIIEFSQAEDREPSEIQHLEGTEELEGDEDA